MGVIGDAADDHRLAAEVVRGAAEDLEQLVAPVVRQDRLAVLGRKYGMQVDLRQ